RLLRWQMRWAMTHAVAVIAVSKALEEKVRRIVPDAGARVLHVPCAGFNPELFALQTRESQRAALQADVRGRWVIFVGLLVPVKGVTHLIEAWRLLAQHGKLAPQDRLIVIGDGPCRRELEQQAAMLGGE